MKILGKPIAEAILQDLKNEVTAHGVKPHLAVILAGDAAASRVYIKYKIIAAEKAGVTLNVHEFSEFENKNALDKLKDLNEDNTVDGIIVQLPVFLSWSADEMVSAVRLEKDVDGFLPGSPFTAATAAGTWEMIREFARIEGFSKPEDFLQNKKIVVLGKGRTAGKPIRELLTASGFSSQLIDSRTPNPQELLLQADLVISATGKKHIINSENIKTDAYIIAIGVGKEIINGEEKLFGDLDEDSIKDKAKLYCPTIGGIGPLTIACLLRNVVKASIKKSKDFSSAVDSV